MCLVLMALGYVNEADSVGQGGCSEELLKKSSAEGNLLAWSHETSQACQIIKTCSETRERGPESEARQGESSK